MEGLVGHLPSDFAVYLPQTTSKPVQMMSMKEKLEVFHIEKPEAIGLQLFYESRDLSLLILLPEDISGLDQVKAFTVNPTPLPSLLVTTSLFSISVSLFLFCIQIHLYEEKSFQKGHQSFRHEDGSSVYPSWEEHKNMI